MNWLKGLIIGVGCLLLMGALFHRNSAFGASFAQDIAENRWLEVAHSREWLRLLHYEKTLFGGWSSRVDGAGFFFASDGNRNPENELRATFDAMKSSLVVGKLRQHPQCAFPERWRFIKAALQVRFDEKPCPKWQEFLKTFHSPQSVSLVFSSAYANNPASMFGHMLLKINSSRGNDLLETGINYAARVPDDENPFAFFYFGVAGGYAGQWSTQPYYVKVMEYVHSESRDLWEYEINFSPDETHRLIAHLWEIETNSHFDYYFFDENCAYQILAAIEAIKVDWDLRNHTIYMIPGEAVKNLVARPGAVRAVQFRPSLRKKLKQRFDVLDQTQRQDFFSLIEGGLDAASVKSRLVLDAAIMRFSAKRNQQAGKLSPTDEGRLDNIRRQRASLVSSLASMDQLRSLPAISEETRPDLGHDSYSLSVFPGFVRSSQNESWNEFQGIRLKSAYHDLMNNDLGFAPFSQIDFPWVEVRRDLANRWYLRELGFLKITSLQGWSYFDQSPSWRFEVSAEKATEKLECQDCTMMKAQGGAGFALSPYSSKNVVYFLALADAQTPIDALKPYQLGPGLEVGWIVNSGPNHKLRVMADVHWAYSPNNEPSSFTRSERSVLEHSYFLARNWELRQSLQFLGRGSALFERSSLETRFEMIHFFN